MNPKKNQKITHRAYDKHYKVMAILLVFFAVLLLLALISYTHKDEEKARVSLFELFGLLSGDPIMEAKAATARNWLGLFGAWIADLFYNKTVGFAFLPVPLFIIAWSRYLFNGKKVSDLLIKNTAMYFAIAVLFSGFMGTLMLFDGNISDISPEWSGSIGQLLAAIFSSLLGAVGSLILLSLAMLITLYLGSDIKISALIVAMKDYSIKIKEKSTQKINDKLSEIEKNKVTADSQIDKPEEHFAKANVSTEIDKESTDTKPEIINDKSVESAFNSLRQPTIIINRNDFRENPKSSNPFDAVQLKFKSDDDSDEIINDKVEKNNQETNISEQEIEIPAFKPNFKHLKDETFTSMDDMSALEMGRKDDDKDTEQDDSQKTTSKTINFTKADLAIDKNDSSTESIGNDTSDEDDTEIEEPFETATNDVETSETSDKSLTVTVN
ncbi:MAG: DNA translocase FtsK 4TM domain-containing protein, partial [Candidatus Kapaibacterium sp.]